MPVLKDLYSVKRMASLTQRCRWAEQLSRTLTAVHEYGYLHRDISPGNVLITADMKTAYLSDFGACAELSQREWPAGLDPSFVGTTHFASRNALFEGPPCEDDDWQALLYTIHWTDPQHEEWRSSAIDRRVNVEEAGRRDPAAQVIVQFMNRALA